MFKKRVRDLSISWSGTALRDRENEGEAESQMFCQCVLHKLRFTARGLWDWRGGSKTAMLPYLSQAMEMGGEQISYWWRSVQVSDRHIYILYGIMMKRNNQRESLRGRSATKTWNLILYSYNWEASHTSEARGRRLQAILNANTARSPRGRAHALPPEIGLF